MWLVCTGFLRIHPLSTRHLPSQAKEVAVASLQRLSAFNRRTADVLSARLYSYYSLAHERLGQLEDIRRCAKRAQPFKQQEGQVWSSVMPLCIMPQVSMRPRAPMRTHGPMRPCSSHSMHLFTGAALR